MESSLSETGGMPCTPNHTGKGTFMATENRIKVRRDELPVVLGRKEPTFLDQQQNSHGEIICPYCNAGYLMRDAGTDDRWSCSNPSCGHSGLTVFDIWMDVKESLSDALYDDMAEYYGIEVENEPQTQETDSEGKMESVDDIKEASLFKFANAGGLAESFASMRDKTYTEVKTGFNIFDREDSNFYGGLHDGLYIIGAVSSLGKTTFCFQLAEQIATLGTPVLYFSLEQSAHELIAKGISRRMYQEKGSWPAKSPQEIMNPKIVSKFVVGETELMENAIKATAEDDKDLYIFEGSINGKRRNLANIREQVHKFYERYKKAPVVFIDYLQIIPPDEKMLRCTEKQITDEAVSQLKEISRSFKTPVIAISSFNRDSYTKPLKLSSFKESGGIEYTADVVIGMHHAFVYEDETKEEKHTDEWYTKKKNEDDERKDAGLEIDIKLAVLKNRNGSPFLANLEFVGKFACFREPDREKRAGKKGSNSVKSF